MINHREGEDDDRINHRGLDLVFDLLRFFPGTPASPAEHEARAHRLVSPAFTILMKSLLKNLRMQREALGEKLLPPWTESGDLIDRVLE